MSKHDQETEKSADEDFTRELLKKSADLKERAAKLREQIDETQKAYNDIVQPEGHQSSEERRSQ